MTDSWNAVVVDDHLAIRAIARKVLESAGHPVLGEAETGGEGLEQVIRLEPDVVLLDVSLPDMSGIEVARQLIAAGSRSAIILISSHEKEDLGDPVGESGAFAFLPKSGLTIEAVEALEPGRFSPASADRP